MIASLPRRLAAELLGTGILVTAVVGSGVMAARLTSDAALSLLVNTLPTGAILVVLISVLGQVSGAHFNPIVTMVFAMRRELAAKDIGLYVLAQFVGGIMGTWLAHLMFDLPLLQVSERIRAGQGQWSAEFVASFGLLLTISGGLRLKTDAVPVLVGLYITAAYWFTASTSFANPAVTIARSLTNTFSGIRPVDVPAFILAEVCGALAATLLAGWIFADIRNADSSASQTERV